MRGRMSLPIVFCQRPRSALRRTASAVRFNRSAPCAHLSQSSDMANVRLIVVQTTVERSCAVMVEEGLSAHCRAVPDFYGKDGVSEPDRQRGGDRAECRGGDCDADHCFGFHSRAKRCPLAISSGVISEAATSRSTFASGSCTAAKLSHMYARTASRGTPWPFQYMTPR